MSLVRRLAVPALTATIALVILLALRPVSTGRALAIWVVLVAGIALLVLVGHSRETTGRQEASRFDAALRRRPPPAPEPVELLRIERELEQVKRTRALHRDARADVPYPVVALVGYTNAGKSTLFNRLTRADVMAAVVLGPSAGSRATSRATSRPEAASDRPRPPR